MRIDGHGITAVLPAGWEGAIRRRGAPPSATSTDAHRGAAAAGGPRAGALVADLTTLVVTEQ